MLPSLLKTFYFRYKKIPSLLPSFPTSAQVSGHEYETGLYIASNDFASLLKTFYFRYKKNPLSSPQFFYYCAS